MNVTHRVAPLPQTIIYMFDYRLYEFLNSLIKLTKHFVKCSIFLFVAKRDNAEPNILVLSSFSKPERHLQPPLCTELDLCLTKQKETNV